MTEYEEALEDLQRHLVSMNVPREYRQKVMASLAVADREVVPGMCKELIAALEWMNEMGRIDKLQ